MPTAPCECLEPIFPVFGRRDAGQCDDRQEPGPYCGTIKTGGGANGVLPRMPQDDDQQKQAVTAALRIAKR